MPKHEAFSPKAIANRQKLKGLQRLRWYCQMCEKQCRDENGFKCHAMSEGHLRQMRIFAQNPNQLLDQFSREFEKGFLQILSHSHGTKRVPANRVYQEYIADKNHVHMNATTWTTLSGFCKYLGREGKCVVEETEKGWFIQYIDRDPQVLLRQAQREERQQSELNEEEMNKRMIENQMRAAYERTGQEREEEEAEEEDEEEGTEGGHLPIKFDASNIAVLRSEHNVSSRKRGPASIFQNDSDDDEEEEGKDDGRGSSASDLKEAVVIGKTVHVGRRMGDSLERLKLEEEQRKKAKYSHSSQSSLPPSSSSQRDGSDSGVTETWLRKDLVVKIIDRESKYYKEKGIVSSIWSKEVRGKILKEAEVDLLEEEKKRIFEERDLQTVIPKVNEKGIFIRGEDRGRVVRVLHLDLDHYLCDVEFLDNGQRKEKIDYELICKIQSPSLA